MRRFLCHGRIFLVFLFVGGLEAICGGCFWDVLRRVRRSLRLFAGVCRRSWGLSGGFLGFPGGLCDVELVLCDVELVLCDVELVFVLQRSCFWRVLGIYRRFVGICDVIGDFWVCFCVSLMSIFLLVGTYLNLLECLSRLSRFWAVFGPFWNVLERVGTCWNVRECFVESFWRVLDTLYVEFRTA